MQKNRKAEEKGVLINQTKRFAMAVLFTGSVNFLCGRLGIARRARGVAQTAERLFFLLT